MTTDGGWPTEVTWIFLSIGDAAKPGEIAQWSNIIGAADSNNHAIPTQAEIETACGQLLGAKLIETVEGGFRLTKVGQVLFEQVNARDVGHITRFLDLAKKWRASPPVDALPVHYWLRPEDLQGAVSAYHEWFSETLERLRGTERKLLEVLEQLRQMYIRATGSSYPHLDNLIDPKIRHHPKTLNYLVASAPGTLQDRYFTPANGDRITDAEKDEFNAKYRQLLDEACALARKLRWPAAGFRYS